MSDERIYKIAEILGTTYEYLTDQTDDPSSFQKLEPEKQKEKTTVDETVALRLKLFELASKMEDQDQLNALIKTMESMLK